MPALVHSQADSTVLTFDAYMQIVREHHPLARQASLQTRMGEAGVQKARGSFDPKLYSNVDQKYFKSKEYYNLLDGGLKVPTWFGVELKGGYERHETYSEDYLNTPQQGLWYAGISVPLGKGLFIDKRRAELNKAKLYSESMKARRLEILNELYYEAGKVYWEWFSAYHTLQVYDNALKVSRERLEAVRQSVVLGDKPAMDTVEAGIQVQNRQVDWQQSKMELENATALLSVYLWAQGVMPLELESATVPMALNEVQEVAVRGEYYEQLDSLLRQHPQIQQVRYKLDRLQIDRKLKQEQLKPELNLRYNALTEYTDSSSEMKYSINDYKWGLEFNMPLFLRKERGDLKLTQLKLEEAELLRENKNELLNLKAKVALNEWQTTREQTSVYRQTVKDYRKLWQGELQMFRGGESSLFLVNYRETSYIKAQEKYIALMAKNRKAVLKSNFALSVFP